MNETYTNGIENLARYSLWSAVFGVLSYVFFFPDGIYYCFFLGVMAFASGVLSKRTGLKSGKSTAGIVIGIFDLGLSMMAFYGLYVIYSSLHDPVYGPKITGVIIQMLEQNGLTIDSFVRVMN